MAKAAQTQTATTRLLGRLWRDWLRPHLGLMLLNIAAIIVVAVTTSAYPLIISSAIEAFEVKSQPALYWVPMAVIAATALRGGALYLQLVLTNRVLSTVEAQMQRAMYEKLIDADLARLALEAPAALAARFTADITYVRLAMQGLITTALRDAATLIGIFCAMLWLDWVLTLCAMAVFPIAAWPLEAIGRRVRGIARNTQEQVGSMTAMVNESLGGVRLAKTYRLEAYLKQKATGAFEELRELKVRAANQRALIDPLLEVLGGLAVAGVLVFIGVRILNGESSVGEFTGFVAALLMASQPIRALGKLNAIVQEGMSAADRVFDLFDQETRVVDRPGAVALDVARGEIAFEDVEFSYDDGPPALTGVTLKIGAGERVALVGRSGAGKSSLFNLIPRLYDVTGGRLTIDGVDVRDATLASLRDQIAVVSQDAVLFDDTIGANIGFGDRGAGAERIAEAAADASAARFIEADPDSYAAQVGAGGDRLSGGERQRIAIARAILKDAPILLLDEATSALDAESEHAVREALDRLAKGRTTLVIAHRLSTIMDADRIVVMDAGRIAEVGLHDELIRKGGLYADLFRLQFQGVVDEG